MESLRSIHGKRFLITGGTGFLGKNLKEVLKDLGAKCVVFGREYDLRYEETAYKIMNLAEYDYIIHAAVLQGASDWPLRHKAEQYDANIRIHSNVLKYWHICCPDAKFIGIGSSCSYPGDKSVLYESEYWSGKVHESVDVYGMTKRMMTSGIEAYKDQYGLKGTTVVFATLYGEHDCYDLDKAHVVAALIRKFVEAERDNLPTVEVWGDGMQTRELIYVKDQIKGLLRVLDYEGEIINIGTGVSHTIRELAETISDVVGYNGKIEYNPDKFVGIRHKVLNIDKAKEMYGWTTNVKIGTLKHGIENTVKWYINDNSR